MQFETLKYENKQWQIEENILDRNRTDIVFTFGDRESIKEAEVFNSLKEIYPHANIVGCSSSGNILGDSISDSSLVATAISFKDAIIEVSVEDFSKEDDLYEVSKKLINNLPKENLKHIFILSDGLNMNGSILAKGVNSAVDTTIAITGGLAADGTDFLETWVIANEEAKQNRVVAVGFYGESITIESSCYSGWNEFGILRKITKSKDNILYEIDGQPALELYKKYLGVYAKNLPSSALDFPMSIKENQESEPIIRSVLGVDEKRQALIFAGDVNEGYLARLMRASADGLINGSEIAAQQIKRVNEKNALGLIVSCVGRRLVLKQLVDEELEVIGETLSSNVQLTGFYSYGELAPFSNEVLTCNLHNQTMTLTVIYED